LGYLKEVEKIRGYGKDGNNREMVLSILERGKYLFLPSNDGDFPIDVCA
jgi:hypothetical protein